MLPLCCNSGRREPYSFRIDRPFSRSDSPIVANRIWAVNSTVAHEYAHVYRYLGPPVSNFAFISFIQSFWRSCLSRRIAKWCCAATTSTKTCRQPRSFSWALCSPYLITPSFPSSSLRPCQGWEKGRSLSRIVQKEMAAKAAVMSLRPRWN